MSSRRTSAPNKAGVSPFVGAQVTPDLKRRLEEAAAEHGSSISEEVRRRLDQSFLLESYVEGTQRVMESLSRDISDIQAATKLLWPAFARLLETQQSTPQESSAGHRQDTADLKSLILKEKSA
jgi:hypothetical protein